MKFNFKKVQERAVRCGGLAAGTQINRIVSKTIQGIKPDMKLSLNAGIRVAIGVLAPIFLKQEKGFVADMGDGFAAGAMNELGTALGWLKGAEDSPLGDYTTRVDSPEGTPVGSAN